MKEVQITLQISMSSSLNTNIQCAKGKRLPSVIYAEGTHVARVKLSLQLLRNYG